MAPARRRSGNRSQVSPSVGRQASKAASVDGLGPLRVLRRIEVGPVQILPNRISATYKVVRGARSDALDLIYRWEEDVFDTSDRVCRNVGAMIAAQVALNYGLFSDEIVFHGPYDAADRRLLLEMAENTAREIYVKKFLEPNPFLIGPAANLPAVKLDSFLHARLVFPDSESASDNYEGLSASRSAAHDRACHVVLSSGGKDSLLSFGLLRELGLETHPVFINESGRHWFTALNAHRHFSAHVANTSRVWTNADRVFSWMLRHFPFIRKDFQSLRSDEYPVRLWTVAVFLFGALPLALKRGAGRIIIGDEYDTTERTSFKGITHYDGLFDQSRHFDNAMSRYYARKGWPICQFSILRPLSELLIEKILVERFADLLELQVSCHAAHKDGARVRPCGKCEKCRRIVGMLKAVGGDPALCGYSPECIPACLADLTMKGVHQEREGAEHMMFMLRERGLLDGLRGSQRVPKEHPEVLRLRFDAERSPVGSIPADLRGRLIPLLLQHSDGAVERSGRMWVRFDPFSESAKASAYPFDRPQAGKRAKAAVGTGVKSGALNGAADAPGRSGVSGRNARRKYIWGELTWPEAQARLKEVDIALLPVGAVEQHGPHLPLDTDAFDANYLAERVGAACSDPKPFVLPLIPYGVSYHHDDFSGTLSVGNESLARIVYDLGLSAARNGIVKLIILNGHGGNAASLHFAAQMINRDARIFTCVDTGETSDADIDRLAETPADIHAGEIETSTTLATRPELVRMDKARKYVPRFSSRYLDFSSKHSVDWYARTARLSRSGVMGDPTKASREKGEKMWDVMINNLVEFVEHLKSLSLDEIHQRNRY